MTKTQVQILELFRTLPLSERQELVEQLVQQSIDGTFFDRMTDDQRAELDRSIGEANRDEGRLGSEVFGHLAQKLGLVRVP